MDDVDAFNLTESAFAERSRFHVEQFTDFELICTLAAQRFQKVFSLLSALRVDSSGTAAFETRVAVHLAVAVSTASAASAACLRFQLSVMHCAWLLISADRDRITVGIVSEFFMSASLDLFFLFHDSILAHLRCASTSPK
jgi:hypothetical protein